MTQPTVAHLLDIHLPKGFLDTLVSELHVREPVSTGSFLQALRANTAKDVFSSHLHPFLQACKEADLLLPCPNNGTHNIRPMSAWNDWLEEANPLWSFHDLHDAPAFRILKLTLVSVLLKLERALEEGVGDDNVRKEVAAWPLSHNQIDAALRQVENTVREAFLAPHSQNALSTFLHESKISDFDGSHHVFGNHLLAPTLFTTDRQNGSLAPSALPALPRPLRRVTLKLTSGRMVVSDVFRFPGFKEGMKTLLKGEFLTLNNAQGVDTHTRRHFEAAGVLIVQTTEHPKPYKEQDGIWRFGWVDEDWDGFWPDDSDEPAGMPTPDFHTASDVWCRSFASPESIVDVMMASSLFVSNQEAWTAFHDTMTQTTTMAMVEVGTSCVHVLMTTGAFMDEGHFDKHFASPDIPKTPWRSDSFLVSTQPLIVDETLLEPHDWTQGGPV